MSESHAGIYLDNAATSFPKPPEVLEAVVEYHTRIGASAGRGAYREALRAGEILAECREAIRRLVNAPAAERVLFTLNCTDALNLALKGILRPGDHVVTTWMDHNSILRPLHRLESEGRISVTRVRAGDDGIVDPGAVAAAFRPDTRLLATLHASNVTGAIQPVAALGGLCRSRGVRFLLDAAQSAGSLPLDMEALGVDLLAMPGHKGLLGPLGTGVLVLGAGIDIEPLREGGTGSRSEEPVQPRFLPDLHEAGSHNGPGIAGLLAGVRFLLGTGVAAIHARKRAITERLLDGFLDTPGLLVYGPADPERRLPVFSLNFGEAGPERAARLLEDRWGLRTRPGLHCAPFAHRTLGTLSTGTVRLSPSFFTTDAEVERTLAAVRELATRREVLIRVGGSAGRGSAKAEDQRPT